MFAGRTEDEGEGGVKGARRLSGKMQVKVKKGVRILAGGMKE